MGRVLRVYLAGLLTIDFDHKHSIGRIITPHAQRERGKVIGRGVHIYICGRKKILNRTLEIDSPFQTLIVGLLVEFID